MEPHKFNPIKSFVNWIENGDLIPALILVSVPHYAFVLSKYDFWAVASVLGFLVDIGHYRTIKTYLRGNGWTWMAVLTAFSTGFHVAFYVLGGAGLWSVVLGCAVPAVIFALAFISRKERLDTKVARSVNGKVAKDGNAIGTSSESRGTYDDFVACQVSRNGNGLMPADEIVSQFGVPLRTAYRWREKYGKAAK